MRVTLDVRQSLGAGLVVDEHAVAIPEKPDRIRLWRAVCADGREPDDMLVTQAPGDALTEWRGGIWKSIGHGETPHLYGIAHHEHTAKARHVSAARLGCGR